MGLGLTGCSRSESSIAAVPERIPVRIAIAEEQRLVDWNTFTGRFEAVESVALRPRVSGYIDAVRFQEGSVVSKGDVLFVIDPRPYRLELDRAEANLARADAQARLARIELARSETLLATAAVSKEEVDRRVSRLQELEAAYRIAQAEVENARLNLEYTEVVAPIDGRISRAAVTVGNYVTTGATLLTSVVSLDPIHVVFDTDETSYLHYGKLVRSGALPKLAGGDMPVYIGLAGDRDFPHQGVLNFVDNALDPATGTIRVRAVIDNAQSLFTPGLVARVRLQQSGEYRAALIDDAAVNTDQSRKYVLVVDDQGLTEYRRVDLGGLVGAKRVVRQGLRGGERVVIGGVQRVRPGTAVRALEEMPPASETASRF